MRFLSRQHIFFALVSCTVGGFSFIACSSTTGGFSGTKPDAGPADAAPALFEDAVNNPTIEVELSGTTYAPNGQLPMAGTLVYVVEKKPEPFQEGAACEKCVTLLDGTFGYSAANGKFSFKTRLEPGKTYYLVTQKGHFRRARQIVAKEAALATKKEDTTLPGKSDPANGDELPKMVVLKNTSYFDHIEASLKDLGITDIEEQTGVALLKNHDELMKYQVVFLPCATKSDSTSQDPLVRKNLNEFVQAGGKYYVTDWSYEYVKQPFGGYLAWDNDTTFGNGVVSEYDAPGEPEDPGLKDWLAAVGDTTFELKGNYTRIRSINTLPGPGEDGTEVMITPKVWMYANEGTKRSPSTVSFPLGCGKVLFSTYHTEGGLGGSTTGFLPQEKALFYVLLDITTCIGKLPGAN